MCIKSRRRTSGAVRKLIKTQSTAIRDTSAEEEERQQEQLRNQRPSINRSPLRQRGRGDINSTQCLAEVEWTDYPFTEELLRRAPRQMNYCRLLLVQTVA